MHENITVQTAEERQADRRSLDSGVAEAVARVQEVRRNARARYDEAVLQTSSAWLEAFGVEEDAHQRPPIFDRRMVEREVTALMATAIEGRLLALLAPVFAYAESIERSITAVGVMARPSGNGPERYAPRRRKTQHRSRPNE